MTPKRTSPYRTPQAPAPKAPRGRELPSDGLDADALDRRAARHREIEDRTFAEQVAATAFWSRAAGLALVVMGGVSSAFGIEAIEHHARGAARYVLLGPPFLLIGLWMLAVGAGGSRSYREPEPWVARGTAIAAVLGIAIGIALLVEYG